MLTCAWEWECSDVFRGLRWRHPSGEWVVSVTHCDSLQLTGTRCITLQHAASHTALEAPERGMMGVTYQWFVSHMNALCHIWMCPGTHLNLPKSHTWISHVTLVSHLWLSVVTHECLHTYQCVLTTHMKESCQVMSHSYHTPRVKETLISHTTLMSHTTLSEHLYHTPRVEEIGLQIFTTANFSNKFSREFL